MFTVNGNTNYTLYLLMNIFLFQDNLGEKEIFNLLYCTVSSFAANHCSFHLYHCFSFWTLNSKLYVYN